MDNDTITIDSSDDSSNSDVDPHSTDLKIESDDGESSNLQEAYSLNEYSPISESNNLVKYYRNDTQYSVKVVDSDGNPKAGEIVSFNIIGKIYDIACDENGIATLNINLNPGNYTVSAIYQDFAVKNNITVLPVIVENMDLVKYFRNGSQYCVKVLNNDGTVACGKEVTFNIIGKVYSIVSDENGIATLPINLYTGDYIITAIFNGFMVSNNITVLSTVTENNDLVKYFRNGSQYCVKLLNEDGTIACGKEVSFNIIGKFYMIVSDENGIATLPINLNTGDYIVTAIFNGFMASNNITVLPIIKAEDIVISQNNRVPFTVTVLDDNGNPACNATVKFNINGNIYEVFSDENGVATLEIDEIYKKAEIESITKDRVIYLCCDNIYSKTKDKQMMEDCAAILRSQGYTVIVGDIGPNTSYSSLTSIPENGVLFLTVGGLCAGTFVDLASNYYQNKLKAKNLQLILGCLSPPITKNLDNLTWLERAHDDNFSPSSFTGLENPGQYLIEHNIPYIYGSSGSDLANNLLKAISGSNQYIITTEYNGFYLSNTINITG